MWDSVFHTHPWVSWLLCFLMVKFVALKKGLYFNKEMKDFNAEHGHDGEEDEAAVDSALEAHVFPTSGSAGASNTPGANTEAAANASTPSENKSA